jgi:hypothetical protein
MNSLWRRRRKFDEKFLVRGIFGQRNERQGNQRQGNENGFFDLGIGAGVFHALG